MKVFGPADYAMHRSLMKKIEDQRAMEQMARETVKAVPVSTINYTITPHRFVLDVPVAALANLSEDSHTRMLAMISEWIARHKPPKVTTP